MSGILRQLALHQPVGVTRARVYETGKQWQPASTLAAVHPLNSRVSPLFPMETGQEMQGLVQTGFSAGSGAGPVSLETRLLRQQRPGDPQPSCSTSGKIAGVAHRLWHGGGDYPVISPAVGKIAGFVHRLWHGDVVYPVDSPAIGKIAGFAHRPWHGGGDYPVISPAVGKIAGFVHRPWHGDVVYPVDSPAIGKIAGVAHRPWHGGGDYPVISPAVGKIAGFVHRPWHGVTVNRVNSPVIGKIAATRTSIPLSLFFWRTPHGYT